MSWNKNHLPYNKKIIDEKETSLGVHTNVNKTNYDEIMMKLWWNYDEIPDPKSKSETNNNLHMTGNKRKKSGPVAFTQPLKPKQKPKQYDSATLIHEETSVHPRGEHKVNLNMRSAKLGPPQQQTIFKETSPHIFDDEI